MKKNAVARIILYSVLVVLLGTLLLGGLTMHRNFWQIFSMGQDNRTSAHSENLTESHSGSVPASEIRSIEINWAAGDITFEVHEGIDTISFSETGNDKHTMAWSHFGDKLVIDFAKFERNFGSRPGQGQKDLTVTVPMDWVLEELEIDAASTSIYIPWMTIDELEIDGASNRVDLSGDIGSLSLDGASNSLLLNGTLRKMDTDGATTTCTLSLMNQPEEISMDGVSNTLTLWIPADIGFTVDADGLSFGFESDFEVTSSTKNHFRYGDGGCIISVDGMSSNVQIFNIEKPIS